MNTCLNSLGKKILNRLLVLLGFGSTFMFMACYGPQPNYDAVDFDDADPQEVVEEADTTVVAGANEVVEQ